ncbi:curlin subunit CsgB [Gallaecimonas xiamenensis]|nr:curlin subunit CsgB [Gallaecimonas xiamenensis]
MTRKSMLAGALLLGLSPSLWAADPLLGDPSLSPTLAALIERQQLNNLANLSQLGQGNLATITQVGQGNLAALAQEGDENSINLTQLGSHNSATIMQFGKQNQAQVSQLGSDNIITLGQWGQSGFAIEQLGSGAEITVLQY